MTNDTKVESSDLHQLADCCDSALANLGNLHDQLTKIIEVKEKTSDNARNNVEFNQGEAIASITANLKQIKLKLPDAIDGIRRLRQQMLLLTQPFSHLVVNLGNKDKDQKDNGTE